MTSPNAAACLMGAHVADAASLGLHWIYDPARVAAVAQAHGRAAFAPLDPANFQGVPAYFAHGARQTGMLTQYGEVLALAIRSLNDSDGRFDVPAYQAAYAAHFGPGGAYVGYIDKPTRGTLANLAAGQTDPSGIDDDQLPAVATLPALVVADPDALTRAIRVTNLGATATEYGLAFAVLLTRVLQGAPVAEALRDTAKQTSTALSQSLTDALANTQSPTDYAETTGRACHLPMALPLAFHILAHTNSFAAAVEANIRAGGDSAGRSIIIGAVMGAAHGIGGANGIPTDYLLNMHDAAQLWQSCQTLAAMT